ncbi:MAG TPA: sigma-54 dependent transcriptional regulator [Candidatus Saccharimonadaceae bacterium]|jgi:DNA-binding NtrC family response regulator|nr:sigma-54 dependent transcriptional regulator [Candidatus Saccharimonadaceae bacterium]
MRARAARAKTRRGPAASDDDAGLDSLAGRSRAMQRLVEQVRHAAPTRASVLVDGEVGAGKGLIAQALHRNSPRRERRFEALDCESVPAELGESALFGVEADGVTRRGHIELADGGSLFLEGVNGLSPASQARLLRFVQDRAFERVGGAKSLRADVRLISAAAVDLEAEVAAGRFREDLFYRLGVVRLHVPALRERREDIPVLVEAFIRQFNREHGRRVTGVTPGAGERLMQHAWPGNVRELKHTIEGMVVFADGRRPLDLSDLPNALRGAAPDAERVEIAVGMTVDEAERHLIGATLRHTGNDKTRAARMLGIGLRTLYRKLKQYGMA